MYKDDVLRQCVENDAMAKETVLVLIRNVMYKCDLLAVFLLEVLLVRNLSNLSIYT